MPWQPLGPRAPRTAPPAAILIIFTALSAMACSGARAELPPHAAHHPRLLFDARGADSLAAVIQAEPARLAVWQETLHVVDSLVALPPGALFDEYYGFQSLQEMSLVARLAAGTKAEAAEEALEDAILHQIVAYDAESDDFLGVLAPTIRLMNLAWGYDNAFSQASEERRQLVVDEILLYLDAMTSSGDFTLFLYNPFTSNKGLTIGAALILGVLAVEADIPPQAPLPAAESLGRALIDKALGDLLGADGTYREGLGYLSWSLRMLLPTWQALERVRGEQAWDDAQARAILESVAYQLLPEGGGALLNGNDHNTSDYLFSRHHSYLEWSTARGTDPAFARWLLRRVSGDLGHSHGHGSDPVSTLLWHVAGAESGPGAWPAGRFFADRARYLHRRGWPGEPGGDGFLLSIEAGKYMGGHAQEDVGQFTLRAFGHGFALDNGAGGDAKETEAHNLVLVDGRGQHNAGSSIGTDGSLELILDTPLVTVLRADLTQAYSTHSEFNDPDWPWEGWDWSWGYDGGNPMRMARRDLLLLHDPDAGPPDLLLEDVLVKDEGGLHLGQWRMHCAETLEVQQDEGDSWRLIGADGTLHMRLHRPAANATDFALLYFGNGNGDPDTRVFQLEHEALTLDYLWQLTPLPPGAQPPTTQTRRLTTGTIIVSTRGDRALRIFTAGSDSLLDEGGDRLRGAWGLVERRADEIRRSALARGTQLLEQGLLLAELDSLGSAAYLEDSVVLSSPALGFRVWAPDARRVTAGGQELPFVRRGDYVESEGYAGVAAPLPPTSGALRLEAPYPNPGGAPLRVLAAAGSGGPVRLELYDVRGRRLRTLFAGALPQPREFLWDGRDSAGRPAAEGIYLLRLGGAGGAVSRKLLLLDP